MGDKVFSMDELYNLVNAQDSALRMGQVTGISSGWYDFASEKEYNERIDCLQCGEEKFEEDLIKAAMDTEEEFEELLNLDAKDFDTPEEYFRERKDIQERIMYPISRTLRNYWNEN